jgi:DNA-binding MarR family transcriptional regulator
MVVRAVRRGSARALLVMMAQDIEGQDWGVMLKRAEQGLLRAKAAALKPAGLTLAQYVALVELEARPGITAAALARACLVTPQAMMVVLKAMHDQGLVDRRRHRRHGNVLELHLTDVGREALETGRGHVAPLERRIYDAMPTHDAAHLTRLLARVIEATRADVIGRPDDDQPPPAAGFRR